MDNSVFKISAKSLARSFYLLVLYMLPGLLFAAGGDNCPTSVKNLGDVAQRLACEMPSIDRFIIAIAYLSGIGFGVAAIFKFKQVKDNPTQIPISTPFALLAVSTMLVFLPGVIKPVGATIFGSGGTSESDTSGPDGAGSQKLMPFY